MELRHIHESVKRATFSLGEGGLKGLVTGVTLLLIGIELILLGGYAYRGLFSRYLQDDYCYGAEVVGLGFFPAQIDSYLHQMPYNSERFSLTLFSGIAEVSGGPRLAPFLAGISIAVWAAALFFVFTQWNQYFIYQISRLALLACALAVPIFTFSLAPNLYQVLYWRSAMLPYLTPLILNTGMLGAFFAILYRGKLTPLAAIAFGLTGFVASGFSETAGLWQFTLWCLVLLLSWLLNRCDRLAWIAASIAIAASALAIGIMLLGPSNSAQLQPFQRPGFLEMITKSVKFTQDFIRASLRSQILTFFVVGCLGLFLGLRTVPVIKRSFRAVFARWLLLVVGCYGLVFAVTVPTMMAMSSPPDDRALLPAWLGLIMTVFASGWLAGGYMLFVGKRIFSRHWIEPAGSFLLGLIPIIFMAAAFPRILDGLSALQHRSEAWDLRQNMILEAKAKGEMHVVVPAFDGIAQILELYPNETFWVNVCAAKYYGIKGISAIEGYNGIKPIFR